MAIALVERQTGGLSFELGRKGPMLLGHQTLLYGEYSLSRWSPGLVDHYTDDQYHIVAPQLESLSSGIISPCLKWRRELCLAGLYQ